MRLFAISFSFFCVYFFQAAPACAQNKPAAQLVSNHTYQPALKLQKLQPIHFLVSAAFEFAAPNFIIELNAPPEIQFSAKNFFIHSGLSPPVV